MRVSVKMKARPGELYDLLMESLRHDIQMSTQKKIDYKDIKTGFEYPKVLKNKLGRLANATAILSRVEKPWVYEAQFKSTRGINHVIYSIEETDHENIEVTYEEKYEPASNSHALNFKVMNVIFKKPSERNAKALLEMMGKYIEENRQS